MAHRTQRHILLTSLSVQFSSVTQSCLTLCDPMDCSMPGLPVHHQLLEFTHSYPLSQWCHPRISSCHPLLLLLSIFPSIRVFSNESILHIRWPKYWSFNFSISTYNEYSGLISFRIDLLNLLAVQETLKSLLQHHSSKASILRIKDLLNMAPPIRTRSSFPLSLSPVRKLP